MQKVIVLIRKLIAHNYIYHRVTGSHIICCSSGIFVKMFCLNESIQEASRTTIDEFCDRATGSDKQFNRY
jgi:hypothetical protein